MTDNGWEASAQAWITAMAERGDFSREHVIDAPLLGRIAGGGFRRALDVGCGEGRLCRAMRDLGLSTVGIEPTRTLRETAALRDPAGTYLDARAEALPFADASFDLVVSCLTLIDIDDADAAIAEMARVLAPGGALMVVNLNSFATAGTWRGEGAARHFVLDNYMDARAEWVSWDGITIRNWHRPFSAYMAPLLATGLQLTHFDEPQPQSGPADRRARYRRMPYMHLMEWRRPLLAPVPVPL